MSDTKHPESQSAIYEIRIRGRLDEDWIEWFDEMTSIDTSEGQTILTGPVTDQAALHGTLNKICSLNLELISVTQIDASSEADSQAKLEREA